MGRFFPYANPEQIIDNMKRSTIETYNSTFDYPKQGAQFFIDIILEQIDKSRLLLNSEVSSIDLEKKVAIVNGEKIEYEVLINTTPLNHFVQLLSDCDCGDISGVLSCNKVLVFNLGFDKQAVDTSTHWTYIPTKDVNFYRMGYYSNILGADQLSMYIEIGYKENDIIDIEEQLKLTLEHLKKLGVITDHKLVSYNTLVINPGYVHITKDSNKRVAEFKELIKTKSAYTIGRYGGWTYCSIEDCMVEAIKTVSNL